MLTSKCPGVPNATDRIGGDLNVSMNQSDQSPLRRVASRSFQSGIYTGPTGGHASMLAVLYGNDAFSILVRSAKKRYASYVSGTSGNYKPYFRFLENLFQS